MAYLNYLGMSVSTTASFLLSVSGGGCWYYKHVKFWVFHKMEAVATDASWLTATAVAMDSWRRLPKRSFKWHVADGKNIAGNNQATLRVNRNSANIAQYFKILSLRDRKWCFTADGSGGCHGLAPLSSEEITGMTHCWRQKHHLWDDQTTLRVDRNSANIAHNIKINVYKIATDANPNYREGLRNLCLRDCAKTFKINFLAARWHHIKTVVQWFFILELATAFVLT